MIKEELLKNTDIKYKEFNSKLIPNIDKDTILGVKVPILRNITKHISSEEETKFKNELPHKYHEENLAHALLISKNKDIDKVLNDLDTFLSYVNNWQVTDIIKPKIFKNNKEKVYKKIKKWVKSKHPYTVRFAVVTLLNYYLDEDYKQEYTTLVINIKSNDYYVNMAIAWYLSFTLVKQYDKVIKIFESKTLNKDIHNKSIQKAIESYRISNETKNYLKSLKI